MSASTPSNEDIGDTGNTGHMHNMERWRYRIHYTGIEEDTDVQPLHGAMDMDAMFTIHRHNWHLYRCGRTRPNSTLTYANILGKALLRNQGQPTIGVYMIVIMAVLNMLEPFDTVGYHIKVVFHVII